MDFNLSTSKDADMDYKPTIYDVKKILDQEIVGEETTKMAVFTHWVLAERNVLMAGPRSSGKTWITDHVQRYFLDNVFGITLGSAKAGWYQVEKIKKCTHIVIFELNQMPADFMEVLKLWGEGKEASYKVVNMVNGVRNVQNHKLPVRPYTFCLADEEELKVGEQLSSRLTVLRTDNSINQNKNVLNEQAIDATVRKNKKHLDVEAIDKIKNHISTMPDFHNTIFKHPAAQEFVNAVPAFFTDCRRDFPKYLDNCYGISRFHWKQRIIKQLKKDKQMMFITPQDMYINHQIFWSSLVDSALKCSALERSMIDILKDEGKSLNRTQIQRKLRQRGVNVSTHMVSRHMNQISDIGYAEKFKDKQVVTYAIADLFNEFKFEIDWNKVVETSKENMKKEFPEVSDEYINNYCNNPIVTDPFTGEEINLNNITVEEQEHHKEKIESHNEEPIEGLDSFGNDMELDVEDI